MDSFYPQYSQLLGLGVLWVSLHCSGMCGPIMAGLSVSGNKEGSRAKRALGAAGRVLAYQGGRGVMYATLGALAGLVGAGLESVVAGITQIAGLVVAALMIVTGIARVRFVADKLEGVEALRGLTAGGDSGRWLGKVIRRIGGLGRGGPWRMAALGFAMGLLPCMMMFWVLGLAASTAHPGHGALVMLLLVAMTTPVLILSAIAPHLVGPRGRRFGEHAVPVALSVSGVWLVLMSSAANGWIDHAWWTFDVGGRAWAVMFW